MGLPDSEMPRRRYLHGLVATGGAAALAACLEVPGSGTDVPQGDPGSRPARQHAWNNALPTDEDGNVRRPNHHALLALDLTTAPDGAASERVESAFRSLERAYAHGAVQLGQTLDDELGMHYGGTVALSAGTQFDLVVDGPPQVARHRGYETASPDTPPATVEVEQ